MATAPAALSFESGDCMRFLILVETPPLNTANRSGDHSVQVVSRQFVAGLLLEISYLLRVSSSNPAVHLQLYI